MFVDQKVYDQVVEKSTKLAKERAVGDPFKPETRQGPQVDKGPLLSFSFLLPSLYYSYYSLNFLYDQTNLKK
jgi:hypothetical protein